MRQKILFRADAGQSIGYGHFIRTLALADMIKNDFDCVFYTQEPTEYQVDELDKVSRYVALPADDSRFQLFLDALNGDEIVVLDNYFYTTDYQKKIKAKGCKLVCIDDMHDKHYVADVVVNQGPVRIEDFDCEPYTLLCLGMEWTLLRKPFLSPLKAVTRKSQIVVCFGGSDPLRLADKVVSMLLQLDVKQEIIVILGDAAFLSDENRHKVTVLQNLTARQMANLFETSLYGILPTSSVSLEALSRGLPIMIGYYVDNQKEGYEKFLERGNFIQLGFLPNLTIRDLKQAIEQFDSFTPTYRDFSQIPNNYKSLFNSLK